jgi:hypothetical protein
MYLRPFQTLEYLDKAGKPKILGLPTYGVFGVA